MRGDDAESMALAEAEQLAGKLHREIEARLQHAIELVIERLPQWPTRVVLSGSGEPLALSVVGWIPRLQNAEAISLTDVRGPEQASAACAVAVAELWAERVRHG
jgi:uncharacterized hydantoinase/oxoprolinase family protein